MEYGALVGREGHISTEKSGKVLVAQCCKYLSWPEWPVAQLRCSRWSAKDLFLRSWSACAPIQNPNSSLIGKLAKLYTFTTVFACICIVSNCSGRSHGKQMPPAATKPAMLSSTSLSTAAPYCSSWKWMWINPKVMNCISQPYDLPIWQSWGTSAPIGRISKCGLCEYRWASCEQLEQLRIHKSDGQEACHSLSEKSSCGLRKVFLNSPCLAVPKSNIYAEERR